MSAIKLVNATKRFGELSVLKPTSWEIESGEFVVLVGPSGCGKSTLLRMIAGLEDLSDGQVWIGGKEMTHVEPKNREVAMVFQNYALYPHLTVRGNLEFPLKVARLSRADRQKTVQKVAEQLEIQQLLDRKPGQLSGGQRQRVAIGRALVREPKVFLFDEPLSNLDARLREQMRHEIAKLHQDLGRTSLYVTHDQAEAMTLADRLAVMKGGEILQAGKPMELYQNPNCLFVAQFLGHPPIGTLKGRFENRQFTGKWGCIELESPPGGTDATLGVRPEDLSLMKPGAPMVTFSGTITFCEHLGRETHGQLCLEGGECLWVVLPGESIQLGQKLALFAAQDKLLFFDEANEQRLR